MRCRCGCGDRAGATSQRFAGCSAGDGASARSCWVRSAWPRATTPKLLGAGRVDTATSPNLSRASGATPQQDQVMPPQLVAAGRVRRDAHNRLGWARRPLAIPPKLLGAAWGNAATTPKLLGAGRVDTATSPYLLGLVRGDARNRALCTGTCASATDSSCPGGGSATTPKLLGARRSDAATSPLLLGLLRGSATRGRGRGQRGRGQRGRGQRGRGRRGWGRRGWGGRGVYYGG